MTTIKTDMAAKDLLILMLTNMEIGYRIAIKQNDCNFDIKEFLQNRKEISIIAEGRYYILKKVS